MPPSASLAEISVLSLNTRTSVWAKDAESGIPPQVLDFLQILVTPTKYLKIFQLLANFPP